MTRWLVFLCTALIGLVLDLWTKHWAFNDSGLRYAVEGKRDVMTIIPGWFDFSLAMNTGAAFSLFAGRFNFFMVISVVAFLTLIYFVHTAKPKAILQPLIVGLIFAGVTGNFFDRVLFEGVRDFIAVHTPDDGFLFLSRRYEWPTFNVADIWICVGALTMAAMFWKNPQEPEPQPAPPESDDGAQARPEKKTASA